jgi:hypothetical protein
VLVVVGVVVIVVIVIVRVLITVARRNQHTVMGCGESKPARPRTPQTAGTNKTGAPTIVTQLPVVPQSSQNGSGHPSTPVATPRVKVRLSKSEVDERIVSSVTIQRKIQADIPMQFAWVSQRGFYPNGTFINFLAFSVADVAIGCDIV